MKDGQRFDLLGVSAPCKAFRMKGLLRHRYVALRPLAEGLGLTWKPQFQKIKSDPAFSFAAIQLRMRARDDQHRLMLGLPDLLVFRWLTTIYCERLRTDIKADVLHYQNLFADAQTAQLEDIITGIRRFFLGDAYRRLPVAACEAQTVDPSISFRPSDPNTLTLGLCITFRNYHQRRRSIEETLLK